MIVKSFVTTIILSIGIFRGVNGGSYSNVFVEREVAPRGYYRYGAPYTSLADPRISQITSLPAITEYGVPCGSPCVFPAAAVVPPVVTPVNPSPNVLTYNAPIPNVPVLVTPPKEATNGYEYSYAVYDENTGDHKAQRELSDGSVVRGEYSFIQPDGYVREVQYVADDISGFNAVVKNFLPVTVESKRKVESKIKTESSPPLTFDCHEIKSESFKRGPNEKSEESTEKHLMKIHEKLHKKLPKEGSGENSKEIHDKHSSHGDSEETSSNEKHSHSSEENSKEGKPLKQKHSKEESGEETEGKSKEVHHMNPKHSKEQSGEGSGEKSKENHHTKSKHFKEESGENSEEENSHPKESGEKSKEKQHVTSKSESNESGEESVSEESKEELKEKPRKKVTKHSEEESREKDKHKSKKESSEENSGEKISHGKHKETFELLKPPQEAVVSYNDIIRCIQAAMSRSYGVPSAIKEDHSPLTYIVLNKPC